MDIVLEKLSEKVKQAYFNLAKTQIIHGVDSNKTIVFVNDLQQTINELKIYIVDQSLRIKDEHDDQLGDILDAAEEQFPSCEKSLGSGLSGFDSAV